MLDGFKQQLTYAALKTIIAGFSGIQCPFSGKHRRSQTQVANIKSAKKRARQAEKQRLANMAQRSRLRTYIKNVIANVEKGDQEAAQAGYLACIPVIDNMSGKGIVHKNKAARHKSRLNKMVKAMSASA